MKDRDIALHSPEITIPNVRLGLEDLLAVIQSLDAPSRARVAHALAETEMEARVKDLIAQLAARAPPKTSQIQTSIAKCRWRVTTFKESQIFHIEPPRPARPMLGQRLIGDLSEGILTACKGFLPTVLGIDFF
jgi:hypothetical protein